MKRFFTNNFFILGGIYFVLFSLSAIIFQNISENTIVQIFDFLLLVLFLFFAIRIYFKKVPKFLLRLQEKYAKTSAYLASVGWIPYISAFFVISIMILAQINGVNNWLNSTFQDEDIANIFEVVLPTSEYIIIFVCLALATYYNFFRPKKDA